MPPDFVIQDLHLDAYDGDQAPVHVHHAGQEAFICIEGDLEVVVDGVRTTVAPGGFVLVPPGAQHTFSSRRGGHVIAVVSAEIAELIEALHAGSPMKSARRSGNRYRSSLRRVVVPSDHFELAGHPQRTVEAAEELHRP